MNHLVIDGCPPWDGEYELDLDFTQRELHQIKEISGGIRGGELLDALAHEDAGAFVALGCVVLARHGKAVPPDDLWNTKRTAIQIRVGDVGPPAQAPNEDGQTEKNVSSGPGSVSVGD